MKKNQAHKTKPSKVAKNANNTFHKNNKDQAMNIKEFKKALKKLSKKTGAELRMPVIPVLEDYRALYMKIYRNVMDKVVMDMVQEQEVKQHLKYIKKYAKNIVTIDEKSLISLDDAKRAIEKAYESIDRYMEKRYGF